MAEVRDGGPAFPHMMASGHRDYASGMTLRDYFAAAALPAVIEGCAADTLRNGETQEQMFARKAFACADALLAARGAQP